MYNLKIDIYVRIWIILAGFRRISERTNWRNSKRFSDSISIRRRRTRHTAGPIIYISLQFTMKRKYYGGIFNMISIILNFPIFRHSCMLHDQMIIQRDYRIPCHCEWVFYSRYTDLPSSFIFCNENYHYYRFHYRTQVDHDTLHWRYLNGRSVQHLTVFTHFHNRVSGSKTTYQDKTENNTNPRELRQEVMLWRY